ncbi:GerAB/ArcD/ProY family transporter [Clostridium uliginosum]|uniref:Spore germination protein (Amino acid permease) n=1 Tax=Clostridium uliginosum TaxID=119641 RepID=A0A1I1MLD7_9CLOT|nr:endospore germination permease [Clostridium uliginosum]SFC86257.1 spore germination protein (amino acid permease) [Clostridium uliginosum]
MKKDLSSKHYIFLILATTLISLRTYSSLFIKYGEQDTWICLLISLVIMTLFFYFVIHTSLKVNTLNMTKTFTSYIPKPIAKLIMFLFSIGLLLTAIESSSSEVNFIHTNLFVESPIWCYLLLFLIPGIYVLSKKFSTILIVIIVSFSFLLFNDGVLAILMEPYKNYSYVLPILSDGLTKDTFKSIILILGSLSSISITLPYLKLLNDKNNLKKHTLIGCILTSIILVFSIVGTIAFLGPQRAANIFYPGLIQAERVRVLEFIEFGQFFYIFRIVIGFFIKYILCAYGIYLIYEDKIKNKIIYFSLFSLIVFLLSYIVAKNNYTLFYSLKYFQLASLTFLLILPLISYMIVSIKYKKNQK